MFELIQTELQVSLLLPAKLVQRGLSTCRLILNSPTLGTEDLQQEFCKESISRFTQRMRHPFRNYVAPSIVQLNPLTSRTVTIPPSIRSGEVKALCSCCRTKRRYMKRNRSKPSHMQEKRTRTEPVLFHDLKPPSRGVAQKFRACPGIIVAVRLPS